MSYLSQLQLQWSIHVLFLSRVKDKKIYLYTLTNGWGFILTCFMFEFASVNILYNFLNKCIIINHILYINDLLSKTWSFGCLDLYIYSWNYFYSGMAYASYASLGTKTRMTRRFTIRTGKDREKMDKKNRTGSTCVTTITRWFDVNSTPVGMEQISLPFIS